MCFGGGRGPPRPAGFKMAAGGGVAAESAAMAGARGFLALLAAALLLAGAVLGAENRPLPVGAPVDVDNADNDEGLQRALRFAMAEYNKASNDMYSSRVVRVISAKRQVGAEPVRAPSGRACRRRVPGRPELGWVRSPRACCGEQLEMRPVEFLWRRNRLQA